MRKFFFINTNLLIIKFNFKNDTVLSDIKIYF